jgi:hypothetical protein
VVKAEYFLLLFECKTFYLEQNFYHLIEIDCNLANRGTVGSEGHR